MTNQPERVEEPKSTKIEEERKAVKKEGKLGTTLGVPGWSVLRGYNEVGHMYHSIFVCYSPGGSQIG